MSNYNEIDQKWMSRKRMSGKSPGSSELAWWIYMKSINDQSQGYGQGLDGRTNNNE